MVLELLLVAVVTGLVFSRLEMILFWLELNHNFSANNLQNRCLHDVDGKNQTLYVSLLLLFHIQQHVSCKFWNWSFERKLDKVVIEIQLAGARWVYPNYREFFQYYQNLFSIGIENLVFHLLILVWSNQINNETYNSLPGPQYQVNYQCYHLLPYLF